MNKGGVSDFCSRDESLLKFISDSLPPHTLTNASIPRENGQVHPRGHLRLIPGVCTVSLFFGSRSESWRLWCRHLEVYHARLHRTQCPGPHHHTRAGPRSHPVGREQGLRSPSSGLVSLPPWGGWSLLGVLADIRVLLVPRFHPGIDNPAAPPAGSPCPLVTVEQCSPPRDTGQRPDRRTGWGHRDGVRSHSPTVSSQLSWAQGFTRITLKISPSKNSSSCLDLQHISA